ncbi:hypothetical protein KZ294_26460, partial [Escherichia coli]|nr:hypothetical protein [Escherichia coli]
ERKQFWWEHFDRLAAPMEDWSDTRGVFTVDSVQVLQDWHKPTPRSRTLARHSKVYGTLAEGSLVSEGTGFFAMFGDPLPEGMEVDESVR